MEREELNAAREFIKQKRFNEARSLLKTIDSPTAKQWLQRLDEVAPEIKGEPNATFPSQASATRVPTQPQRRSGGGIFTSVFLLILIMLTLGIVVYGTFLRPSTDTTNALNKIENNLGQVNRELSTLSAPTPTVPLQSKNIVWDYLTVSYNQITIGEETGLTSDPKYDTLFKESNDCLGQPCAQKVFKGLPYYLNEIGKDGWQLVSVVPANSSYNLFFIRPDVNQSNSNR